MHRDQAEPSASSAPSDARVYRAAGRLVRGWADRYSRDVPPHLAQRRLSAIDFELWEHADAMDRRCWSVGAGALQLVLRTAAGAPRDLRWQRSIRVGRAVHLQLPGPLVPLRHRRTLRVPLQAGRRFDQSNGVGAA